MSIEIDTSGLTLSAPTLSVRWSGNELLNSVHRGTLVALWRAPDRWANFGIWRATDAED